MVEDWHMQILCVFPDFVIAKNPYLLANKWFCTYSIRSIFRASALQISSHLVRPSGTRVHCCTIFHLRSGLWNIVQGGKAIYGVADCKWGHRGKNWPNWVPFFLKSPLTQCSGWPKKISPKISTQISTEMGLFWGVWSLCGNWGWMRKLGLYRGMSKLTEEWANFTMKHHKLMIND